MTATKLVDALDKTLSLEETVPDREGALESIAGQINVILLMDYL